MLTESGHNITVSMATDGDKKVSEYIKLVFVWAICEIILFSEVDFLKLILNKIIFKWNEI